MSLSQTICLVVAVVLVSRTIQPCDALYFTSVTTNMGEARSALHHLFEPPTPAIEGHSYLKSVQDLANLEIPRRDGGTLLAYQATSPNDNSEKKVILLLHEFFGLSESICDKADALASELDCTVIAPDTFRGESSTFIPKCIWLALSTPQDRVNDDLDDVVQYCKENDSHELAAVMGFCYGGGKAIRYTTQRQPDAATVICYGSPLADANELQRLTKPVCGVYGADDFQFPKAQLDAFHIALKETGNADHELRIYDGVGHAFWKDMKQIERQEQPQYDAYQQIVGFLKMHM